MQAHAAGRTPAPWIKAHAGCVPAAGHVLDLACGGGRHARLFLARGHAVTALDRDLEGVADLAKTPGMTLIQADLEAAAWPLAGQRYDAVVVCNYLHRPLLRRIVAAVAPGGVLLYDTFAAGNERFGRPRNPDFLLQPNELLHTVGADFIVHAYRHCRVTEPAPAMRQSLCAERAR